MSKFETIETDVLIIGGGGAGARAAIEVAGGGGSALVLLKGLLARSGLTPMAYPSFQAAFGHMDPRDNPNVHFEDTCRAGRFLGDQNLVRALADEATDRALDLKRYGVGFKMNGDRFFQVRHPGQTYPRNLVIELGGFGLISGLKKEVRRHPQVTVLEDQVVTRLLVSDGRVTGATVLDLREGKFWVARGRAVILATGGYEQLWDKTDTAPDSTGDGVALAYQAGADLVDLEMMLYYPTVVVSDRAKGTLVQYESLLAEQYIGGRLINSRGEEFVDTNELPTRDVLMKLMFEEVKKGFGGPNGGVFIDISRSRKSKAEIDELLAALFSVPARDLPGLGIDPREEPLEVLPATHFTIGGVRINEFGETTVPGLLAAGEVAGNLHGANRISGNALAETQVFGARAGKRALEEARRNPCLPPINDSEVEEEYARVTMPLGRKGGLRPVEAIGALKQIMDDKVNYWREERGLQEAGEKIRDLRRQVEEGLTVVPVRTFNNEWRQAVEVSLMLQLAEQVCLAASTRKESRGHHHRIDYPEISDGWQVHTICTRSKDGARVSTAPVIVM